MRPFIVGILALSSDFPFVSLLASVCLLETVVLLLERFPPRMECRETPLFSALCLVLLASVLASLGLCWLYITTAVGFPVLRASVILVCTRGLMDATCADSGSCESPPENVGGLILSGS